MVSSDRTADAQAAYMKKYDMSFYAVPYNKAPPEQDQEVVGWQRDSQSGNSQRRWRGREGQLRNRRQVHAEESQELHWP